MQIEKIQVTRSDNDLATKTLEAINKINEIIDWIDDVSNFRVTNKQVTANRPNIDIGELAKKAEKECRFNSVEADREVYDALTTAKNVQDKFAEQRKWLEKLCWFWNDGCCDYIGILYSIHDLDEIPFENDLGEKYQHCRPVKPDDDIIYRGE
jgi:hypothetical protein